MPTEETAQTESAPLPADHVAAQDAPDAPGYPGEEADRQQADLVEIAMKMAADNPDEPTATPFDSNPDSQPEQQALTNRATPESKDAPKAGTEQEGQPDEQASAVDPEELERAREAMQRVLGKDNFEAIAEGLTDEAILERGGKLAKQFSDQQRVYNENQELQSKIDEIVQQRVAETLQQQAGETQSNGQPPADNSPVDADLAQAVSDEIDQMFEESDSYIDDDVKGAMRNMGVKLASTLAKQFKEQTSAITQQAEAQMNALNLQRDRLEMQRISLDPGFQKEHPEIRNPEQFERVVSTAYELAKLEQSRDEYFDAAGNPRFDRLMQDAAKLVSPRKNTTKQAQVDMARRQRSVSGSQPLSGVSHGQPASPEPTEEAARAEMMDIFNRMASQS